jgi:hypothetical protein
MINYDQVRELYFENPEFGFYIPPACRRAAAA